MRFVVHKPPSWEVDTKCNNLSDLSKSEAGVDESRKLSVFLKEAGKKKDVYFECQSISLRPRVVESNTERSRCSHRVQKKHI